MKYILSSTALLGCVLGASLGVTSPDQSYGALDAPLQTVSQIVSPIADAVTVPIAGGSCTFFARNDFRGRSQTIRYRGNGQNSRVGNLSFTASSFRVRGTATLGLFSGRNLNGNALVSRPITSNHRRASSIGDALAFSLNSTRSAVCGISSAVRAQL